MYTIREAEVRNVFHGISSTIEGMSLAMYLAEMAAALSPTGEEAAKELRLLLNCLYMISEGKTDLHVVKAVFELRTMSECGFLPQLVCCKICENTMAPRFILTRKRAFCSVRTVRKRRAKPAIWTWVPCMPCVISAL